VALDLSRPPAGASLPGSPPNDARRSPRARRAAAAILSFLLGAYPASAGFAHRKLLTVNGSQVAGGPHTNFPVAVGFVEPDLRLAPAGGVRSAAGDDISFRASDGVTPLDYEISKYDPATGRLRAYVKLPSIQSGVDTQFYVYYGDPEITCCQTRHGDVWDAGFRTVLHFSETSGNPIDSTAYGTATRLNPQGDPAATISQAGDFLEMITPPAPPPATNLPTTDSHLQLADGTLPANTPFTIEAWFQFRASNVGQWVGLVTKNREGTNWVGLYKRPGPDRLALGMACCGSGPGNLDGATVLVPDQWYYGAVSSNGIDSRRVFLYDAIDAADAVTPANYTDLSLPTRLGDDSNGNYLDGFIGEVRFSTVERSPAWIQTGARNHGCPAASMPAPSCAPPLPASLQVPFLTVGAEESLAATNTDPDCCRVIASDDGTRITASTSSLAMVFDRTDGGGLTELRVAEEANRTVSRNGDTARYNVFSTQVNDGAWHFERDAAGELEVLEATPTRVKLRQRYDYTAAIHLDRTWTIGAMPRLAVSETLVLDSDQTIRGAQGLHPRGATSGGAGICPSQLISSGFGSSFYCAGQGNSTDRFFLVTDDHESYGDMLAVAHSTPFFGPTRAGTGGNYQDSWESGTPESYYARTHEPTQILTTGGSYNRLYMFYPSLAGLTSAGTEWQPYATDYRSPDALTFNFFGTGWFDAGELTSSPSDFFGEAEGAYLVDFNPASGLSVNLDGNTTTRRRPLFKIRQWRSVQKPTVSLEGTPLVNDRDYTADVKPFVRSFHCTGPAELDGCTALANGGLTSANEYLNDPSGGKNYPLAFPDFSTWFYVGAESRFRGINVLLATVGAGTADLQWEYWNGASWADLEGSTGWNDQTNNLKQNGTIYWGDDALELDPIGWSTLAINGSPPLYYVRARLSAGSYTTDPVELILRTDILLFQYCGDVSIADATFAFSVPLPTEVKLSSFEALAGDASVRLEWTTASELQNLGFHLYRSLSAEGPFERITPSLIPGLGSSPSGANYSYRDTGLENGRVYFYRLEDIETTGKTTLHGPVSATPSAGLPPDTGETGSLITYGRPEQNGFQVLERTSEGMVLELTTGGFTAEPQGDGSVLLSIPGFEPLAGSPSVPVLRPWIETLGRGVTIVSVRETSVSAFSGLRPSGAEADEIEASREGAVRARRGRARAHVETQALVPLKSARLLQVGFQGEKEKAQLELAPLRWDGARGELVLATRLTIRIDFRRRTAVRRGPAPRATRRAAARLVTERAGLHEITYEAVFSSGSRGRGVPIGALRLSRLGKPVAFHVEPDGARFAPGSKLYFLSEGPDANPYGRELVYELELGEGGLLMERVSGPPSGEVVGSYFRTEKYEENRYYQAGLLSATDLWLWEVLLAPVSKSFPFEARELAPGPSWLTVWLQGASDFAADPDHHVKLYVNEALAGEHHWNGKEAHEVELDIPSGGLQVGRNVLRIENVGDTEAAYSMVMLDRFEVTYPRSTVGEEGRLEGSFSISGSASVTGLGASHVLDTTGGRPRWITGGAVFPDGTVRFRAEAGRSYLAVSDGSVERPVVRAVSRERLRKESLPADYLVVGPREFAREAAPLLAHRRSEGLTVKFAALEDVYSEFGFGEARPEAIREFLSYAYHHGKLPKLRYVLLLGDATYDFKDYLKTGVVNQLPPLMVKTSYLWTASDPTLAAVNGRDLLPDFAVGRLPASSAEELRSMVSKILAYETAPAGLDGLLVLAADNADAAGDFPADAVAIEEGVLAGKPVRKLFLHELRGSMRGEILRAFDEGASLVSYVGHGGIHLWADENVFNTKDVSSLAPQSRQPLLLTMNCLNGYFHFPYFDSLSEELVKADGKGAIAAFSPSGLSLNGPANTFHQALLDAIFRRGHRRLGDAVLAAQESYAATGAFPELLSIYHLFGDPALRLR